MLTAIVDCIPSLRRYASALLRNRQDADDLVHDCLVRALDKLHTRRADGDVRAWLFAIMHNLFVSQKRRSRLRQAQTEPELEADISTDAGQENSLLYREVVSELYKLPQEQRQVLLLVSVEDFTYAEAAQVLGVPIGTVMSRLARGRERLRRVSEQQTAPFLRRVK